eukprot:5091691-Alexandrium_andersonii.AAC.1
MLQNVAKAQGTAAQYATQLRQLQASQTLVLKLKTIADGLEQSYSLLYKLVYSDKNFDLAKFERQRGLAKGFLDQHDLNIQYAKAFLNV